MQQSKAPGRPSGIPRPVSKIPLPTQLAVKTIRPSPSRERLQADAGVDHRRLRRPSQETLTRRISSQHLRRRESTQTLHSFIEDAESPVEFDGETWDTSRGRTNPLSPGAPSLSDRTIETLSRIPPSPSPHNRRTLHIGQDTSMGPPLRPASRLNGQSRSPSISSHYLGIEDGDGPGNRSSIIGAVPSKRGDTLPLRPARLTGSDVAKSKPRLSLSSTFVKPTLDEVTSSPITIKKTRQPPSNISSNMTSPSSITSKNSSNGSEQTIDPDTEIRKVSKSSNALRESIAKAKAARKASRKSSVAPAAFDAWDNSETQDPFGQLPKDGNKAVLQKRVDTARKSGSLNIAALDLTTLPDEVLKMYEYDPNANSDWFENVDLVKFIAADNELATLPDEAFPDIDPETLDMEDESKGNQFGGLEILDLHGNILQSLPIGIRRLQRLTSLNLSNNQFKMRDIEVVAELEHLVDLKLANNNLDGTLLSGICQLANLEVLDLHGNRVSLLPNTISELRSLKILNLAENELISLPSLALSKLPLVELNASRNKLQGSLFESTAEGFKSVQTLNVAFNSLDNLSEDDGLNLPSLQFLLVDANRLKAFPSLMACQSLLRITAEGNGITTLPDGFFGLNNLKHVDLTANDLSKLDERIGLMDNLVTFNVSNNPLRERKFLTMDTEDLKNDLRNRCNPPAADSGPGQDSAPVRARSEAGDEDEEGSVATEFTLAPESPSHLNRWKVKTGGVLDRSATEMTELDADELKPLLSYYDIKCLYLQRNKLQTFPVLALNLISTSLVDLDLSKNPLKADSLFSEPVSLPHLQSLTLNGSSLTAVDVLFENLLAPALKFLDISNNRLAGSLPFARQHYPRLITYLAADNQLSSLEYNAVQGLQVLDISNNNIDFLPPKIGLLGGEDGGGLKRFEVAGNRFRVPRWQVVQKGTEAILEWLKGRIPADDLNEVGTDAL
ncbi:conserved leucine-rich repeat protein [Talaromyces marneffei ATCC 18224]|uniref:Conserved leucine-rich repeat protein n=1 Tax=Talaromyces marneffei (strain ATCC 18224 / CBS 334.59 / QM 7333) TaxID=441960 RepID=B6QGJ4_TALMQ|nr:conserved leucine-rich repeat protein [Talaromyces marneffei ATCC 18224]